MLGHSGMRARANRRRFLNAAPPRFAPLRLQPATQPSASRPRRAAAAAKRRYAEASDAEDSDGSGDGPDGGGSGLVALAAGGGRGRGSQGGISKRLGGGGWGACVGAQMALRCQPF